MSVVEKRKIVLLGFLSHFPVAGVAWQTMHYLVGFQRLGFDVYYVEAHGCTPSKLMQHENDDGPARAAAYIDRIMRRIGLEHSWAYHSIYDSRYLGLSESRLKELYKTATLLVNLHGSHLPTPELAATGRLIYLETDPVDVQIDLFHQKAETLQYLSPHTAFFTYGENVGRPDCLVPAPQQFNFRPTRQPVVLDFWKREGCGGGECFTTVGNWRQPWRELNFKGEVYRWSKHLEFEKFLSLPSKVNQAFELALSSFTDADLQTLANHGWKVRSALEISTDPDRYRDYVTGSRGEFTVAKDQNVRLRSGWFSDRAVTYLAAGRPVITQETGFSNFLPTGHGLFGFSTLEDAVQAVEQINGDYQKHAQAAVTIAREYFGHEVVLGQMLNELGLSAPLRRGVGNHPLSPDLVVVPTSRWPTRLPEQTLQTAEKLPAPQVPTARVDIKNKASIVVVTHNGLAFTKLCLTSLLSRPWPSGDELIIVDNASTDGTQAFLQDLRRQNRSVNLVINDENKGFAAANNQGLEQAKGDLLILLNPDTLLVGRWREGLARWLEKSSVGMVGPVTNRTCNEAQIDAPYKTLSELERFAEEYTRNHQGQANPIAMLAMFCVAFRREVYERVGPLDERFEVGMFEDDDYARRVRVAGYEVLCAEDVFVHHFGQGSFGTLCATDQYNQILETNRHRFEEKWNTTWKPHPRRITAEYSELRQRIRATSAKHLPPGATVAVISKGDDELVKLNGHRAWHFPQGPDGAYANIYPADGAEALEQLKAVRARGARFLLIPKPALWWLDYYRELKTHLESRCRLLNQEEACLIFDLGGSDA
jgi:GT2 family glycosyltransferase